MKQRVKRDEMQSHNNQGRGGRGRSLYIQGNIFALKMRGQHNAGEDALYSWNTPDAVKQFFEACRGRRMHFDKHTFFSCRAVALLHFRELLQRQGQFLAGDTAQMNAYKRVERQPKCMRINLDRIPA
jgi:hypothetical protein